MTDVPSQRPLSNPTRFGYVAVLGVPNAGKSTLMNAIVGQKVSIVSPKIQTTRHRILGILCQEETQIVLMDTPGIFSRPRRRLERSMIAKAWSTPDEADLCLVIVDAKRPQHTETEAILKKLLEKKASVILVLNKIDLVKRDILLGLAEHFSSLPHVENIFMISALKKDGTQDILDCIASRLPESPWLYPEDQITDMPERLLAAEVTREHLFHMLFDELPYALHVETEKWEVFRNGSLRISQTIFVQKESQRAILLGHEGRQIKRVGAVSRKELTKILGRFVHLFLHIKVRANWDEHPEPYKILGLDFKA